MPEKIDKDGKKFWAFPKLPFDVGARTASIYDFYMRTNPETGELVKDQWAVYPNNSTPRTLGPLLDFLTTITTLNAVKLASMPGFGDVARLKDDHANWVSRLAFYRAKREELFEIDPDQPVGTQNPVSKELALYIVEPLFLGWYPTDTPPFSTQAGIYSQNPQEVQSVMDLYMPLTIANQIAITRKSQGRRLRAIQAGH